MVLVPPLGLSRELLTTPGDSLAEALEECNLTPEMAAEAMQISTARLNAVITDGAAITRDMAQKLASLLGIRESFWMNLQRLYEEELEQIEAQEKQELSGTKHAKIISYRRKPFLSTAPPLVCAYACLRRVKKSTRRHISQ